MDYRKLYKEHYCIEFGSDYAVHHIDGNRSNNDISNLLLMPRHIHTAWHNVQLKIELLKRQPIQYGLNFIDFHCYPGLKDIRKEVEDAWFNAAWFAHEKWIEDNCQPGSTFYCNLRGQKEWEKYEQKTI